MCFYRNLASVCTIRSETNAQKLQFKTKRLSMTSLINKNSLCLDHAWWSWHRSEILKKKKKKKIFRPTYPNFLGHVTGNTHTFLFGLIDNLYGSGVPIIADVAESIAETQPISINRIEIWDRLIGKNSKRTSLQSTNCYWHEYTSMYIDKDGGAQCASQTTRMTSEKYFPTLALNRCRRYGNTSDFTEKQPVRWQHKT